MSMAMPAVSTRMIGSTYTWMMTHAIAPVIHIVDTSIMVLAQWLIVNPFSQYNLFGIDSEEILMQNRNRSKMVCLLVGSFDFVWCIAYFAFERFLWLAATLNQPSSQAFMMHGAHIAGAFARLNQWFRLICIVADPAVFVYQKRLSFFRWRLFLENEDAERMSPSQFPRNSPNTYSDNGCACDRIDLSAEQFTWIQNPQLFGRHWIPQTAREPQRKSNFKRTEYDVVPIARRHWHFILPEAAQCFRCQKANDNYHHNGLTQQTDACMIHLHQIDIMIFGGCIRFARVVDELAANFEKHFDTVNEKEDENDEQQKCVAAAEEWCVRVTILGHLRRQNLRTEQTVRQNVECEESEETLRQELCGANVAQMENLRMAITERNRWVYSYWNEYRWGMCECAKCVIECECARANVYRNAIECKCYSLSARSTRCLC